jgi:hypothetical protein
MHASPTKRKWTRASTHVVSSYSKLSWRTNQRDAATLGSAEALQRRAEAGRLVSCSGFVLPL